MRTKPERAFRAAFGCSLGVLLALCAGLALLSIAMLFTRVNVLVLGIDRVEPGTALGRSDTMILATFAPLKPYVGTLSIPRDLWVTIPGVGENRINTAHFFAEAEKAGSGPAAALETCRQLFGVDIRYFVRFRFEGVVDIVEALGGIDLVLEKPMAGYPAGRHSLNGQQALAFVRSRAGADDFFRMEQGQVFLRSVLAELFDPRNLPRFPRVWVTLRQTVESNIPPWALPAIGTALLRAGPAGIDGRTIPRQFTTPITTQGGAAVLLPNWDLILPLVEEMFGE